MKILIVAENDWTGAGYALAQAISKYTPHEARQIVFNTQWYTSYPADIVAPSDEQLREWLEWADVVSLHDDLGLPEGMQKPVLKTYHGSLYRGAWRQFNAVDMRLGYLQTALTIDLAMLGPHWVGRPIELLSRESHDGFIVAHAPTSRDGKGTELVIEALQGLDGITLDVIEGVDNVECLRRKARADVVIDQVGPHALGYGTNALEAWAMGIPVISDAPDNVIAELQKRCYNTVPFIKAHTADEIREAVLRLADDANEWDIWSEIGRQHVRLWHNAERVALHFCELAESVYTDEITVSLAMIVWNEEELLEGAVQSAKGLADEVVIVDTGSTDDTVVIAERLGCKVITGADRMNKAQARNLALDNCTGDWIVVLDADEKIADPCRFRKMLRITPDDALAVEVVYLNEGEKGEEAVTYSFQQVRAWRWGVMRYKYRAHETPLPEEGPGGGVAFTDLVFEHRRPSSRESWKQQYTLDRILLDVAENLDDERPLFYLARQYMYMERYLEALAQFEKYVRLPNAKDKAEAYMHMAQCHACLDSPDEYLFANLFLAAKHNPRQRSYWGTLAVCYATRGDHELAVGMLKLALELSDPGKYGDRHQAWYGRHIYWLLAKSLQVLGRFDEAKFYLLKGGYKLDE